MDMLLNRKPRILVVGSLVMDLITQTDVFPRRGETVLGRRFTTAPGGKGANQAVQAARLGADVTMVGRVGCDSFGDALLASLKASGVDVCHVSRDKNESSAVGNITLERLPNGDTHNRIIVVPGANMTLDEADVNFLHDSMSTYDLVMLQFEIPMQINTYVARLAQKHGVPVMVNPAPAAPIPSDLLACTTYLSPNEHEASAITGIPLRVENGLHKEDMQQIAHILRERGTQHLLVTLGENGAAISSEEGVEYMPCVPNVTAVDPTAAGDSFVSAFCTGICVGLTHTQAIDFARNTAAITVSRMGAQPSLPKLSDVLAAMQKNAQPRFPFSKLAMLAQSI